MQWDAAYDETCRVLVASIVDDATPRNRREIAWKQLFERIGPSIEP